MVYAEWQVGQVVWTMLWLSMFSVLIWVLIKVLADILRSPALGGWGKALWTLFVIFVPLLGVLAYMVANGGRIVDDQLDKAQKAEAAKRATARRLARRQPST
jgi:hypothetical protein